MSRHWKQRYSQAAASAAGIHDHEGTEVVGRKDAQWIFYVRECGFTSTFFSIEMLKEYLDFYSRKTLPTSRFCGMSAFSNGPAACVGGGQSKFERLPGYCVPVRSAEGSSGHLSGHFLSSSNSNCGHAKANRRELHIKLDLNKLSCNSLTK